MLFKYGALLSFVTLVTCAETPLNTTCHTTGVEGDCSSFIQTFCTSIGSTPLVDVKYPDTTSRCFTADSGMKCDFTAWNVLPSSHGEPNLTNCKRTLTDVASTCPQGGASMLVGATFQFHMDPNTGECSPPAGN
ncbi:hypothetical protein C8J56DRAFT_920626 [Mycena floridula]|nr:hypothetical protein C8J56DRAFT_920626 [Mycena floridula]